MRSPGASQRMTDPEMDVAVRAATRSSLCLCDGFDERTRSAESNQGERIAKASGGGDRPLGHRRLAPKSDAAPPASGQAVGRDDPSDNPRPALRRQRKEALLRVTRTRMDHRDSRL